jgi:AcrR family transcriptional regulator
VVYDSEKTRTKLLDAALEEFVEHGLAGGRVDRIAKRAGANKQAIYAYFGSKEGLFDAVLVRRLSQLAEAVPITPADLGGFALRLYDYLCAHPEYSRMVLWKRLEHPDPTPEELEMYRRKLDEIDAASALPHDSYSAINVLLLVTSLAHSWANSLPAIRALDDRAETTEEQQARHRAALAVAVEAAVAALGRPAENPIGS